MKPNIIRVYQNDSLALRVAIYDDRGQPFDPVPYDIESATLRIGNGADIIVPVEYKTGNIVEFLVQCDIQPEPGQYSFYVFVYGDKLKVRFTVATGTLIVLPLPS